MRPTFRGRLLAPPLLLMLVMAATATAGCRKDSKPKSVCGRFVKLWKKYEKTKGSIPADKAFQKMTRAECVKEMAKTKKRSAAEYKCVVKCSNLSSYDEAILCSVKCAMDHAGKSKGSPTIRSSKDGGVGCKPDWLGTKLKPINDKVTGQSFTVSLPAKLIRKEVKADGPVPASVAFKRNKNDLCNLSFTVDVDEFAPKNAKAFSVITSGKVIARKDLPNGVLVVLDTPKMKLMEVKIWRKNTAGKSLRLTIALWYNDMEKEVAAHRKWMVKTAQTFRAN